MKTRSGVFLGLLALVLAFGMITGCEGPAGPGGPSGTEGFNGDELAFIHANGFAVTAERILGGITNGGAITAQGATVTWPLSGAVTIDEAVPPINIPAGGTFDIVTNSTDAFSVDGVALTVNGGAGSVFKVSGGGALTTTSTAGSQLTVNVPVLVLETEPSLDGASTVNMSGVTAFDMPAPTGGDLIAFFTEVGVTNTAGKKVTLTGDIALSAAATFAELNIEGDLTLPGAPLAVTAPVLIEGDIVADGSSGSIINGDVTTRGVSSLTTGALTLGAGRKLTVTGTSFTATSLDITAPGGIELKGGALSATGNITGNVTVTGAATLGAALTLATGSTLTVQSGSLTAAANNITAPGGIMVRGTLSAANNTIATGGTGAGLTVQNGGVFRFANATPPTMAGVTGDIQVQSGGTLQLTQDTAGNSAFITIRGYLASGATLDIAASKTLTVAASTTLDLTGLTVKLGATAKIDANVAADSLIVAGSGPDMVTLNEAEIAGGTGGDTITATANGVLTIPNSGIDLTQGDGAVITGDAALVMGGGGNTITLRKAAFTVATNETAFFAPATATVTMTATNILALTDGGALEIAGTAKAALANSELKAGVYTAAGDVVIRSIGAGDTIVTAAEAGKGLVITDGISLLSNGAAATFTIIKDGGNAKVVFIDGGVTLTANGSGGAVLEIGGNLALGDGSVVLVGISTGSQRGTLKFTVASASKLTGFTDAGTYSSPNNIGGALFTNTEFTGDNYGMTVGGTSDKVVTGPSSATNATIDKDSTWG
jgi:hypothetical protein